MRHLRERRPARRTRSPSETSPQASPRGSSRLLATSFVERRLGGHRHRSRHLAGAQSLVGLPGRRCARTRLIAQHATHARAHVRESGPPRICSRTHEREWRHSRFRRLCRHDGRSKTCGRVQGTANENTAAGRGDSPPLREGLPRGHRGREPRPEVAHQPVADHISRGVRQLASVPPPERPDATIGHDSGSNRSVADRRAIVLEAAALPEVTTDIAVVLAKLVRQLRPILTQGSETRSSTRNPAA